MTTITQTLPVVYTWVDDAWEGYLDLRDSYSKTPHDRNPNRTRDNLHILKYSLRTLHRHAPWAGPITIVSMRPQVPHWLNTDHPQIRVVHHDDFMPPERVPTFSSFSIYAQLHLIPGIGERFLQIADDTLFIAPLGPETFFLPDGKLRLLRSRRWLDPGIDPNDRNDSPWNRALAGTARALDAHYGSARRLCFAETHIPLAIDIPLWKEMWERFPEQLRTTAESRFRDSRNIVPEELYPHVALEAGRAEVQPLWRSLKERGYHGLENTPWINTLGLWWAPILGRKFMDLNDNLGDTPNPVAVAQARRFLERLAPDPSPYEKT